jgi:hypothetical protein
MITQINCATATCKEVCYYPCRKITSLMSLYADLKRIVQIKTEKGEDVTEANRRLINVEEVIKDLEIDNIETVKQNFQVDQEQLASATVITWECVNGHRNQYVVDCN